MQMLFRQRLFSWFDSYGIYAEDGSTLFTVQGQLSWGHCLKFFDANGYELGTVKERVLTFLPKFELYEGDTYIGCITKEFTLFKPVFHIDCDGWQVEGDFWEWDYQIVDSWGHVAATVSKQLWNWTDTYSIEVADPRNALHALMVVLAIDAEKCSRNNG